MIFKQRVVGKNNSDAWSYIDGITECVVFRDDENRCMCIDIMKDKNCIMAIHSEAYLLNDSGKTIERICVGGMFGDMPITHGIQSE